MHGIFRCAIAAGLPAYLKNQHRGLMVPCAYIKERSEDVFDAGVAFFVAPDPASHREEKVNIGIECDADLGVGSTHMIADMLMGIVGGLGDYGVKELVLIGMDLRPRLAIGSIALYFAIRGEDVIVIKDQLIDGDPVFDRVVRAGFSSLPYAPMVPFGFDADDPDAVE